MIAIQQIAQLMQQVAVQQQQAQISMMQGNMAAPQAMAAAQFAMAQLQMQLAAAAGQEAAQAKQAAGAAKNAVGQMANQKLGQMAGQKSQEVSQMIAAKLGGVPVPSGIPQGAAPDSMASKMEQLQDAAGKISAMAQGGQKGHDAVKKLAAEAAAAAQKGAAKGDLKAFVHHSQMQQPKSEAMQKLVTPQEAIALAPIVASMQKIPPTPARRYAELRKIAQAFPGVSAEKQAAYIAHVLVETNQVESIKADLDSMSEMGEMESLRLQMAMDRMSKMMSTLSNLLKKISDTSQSITQNLK